MAPASRLLVGFTSVVAVAVGCAQGTLLGGDQLGSGGGPTNGSPSAGGQGGASGTATPTGSGAGNGSTSTAGSDATGSTSGSGSGAATTTGSSTASSSSGNGSSSATTAASSSSASSASSSSGTTACAHSDCDTGAKLAAACDPCVAMICAVKASCCSNTWGAACVADVASVCGDTSCPAPTCAHGLCTVGAPLTKTCDPCAADVCSFDPYCCSQALGEWDATCVSEVDDYCTTATCP